MGLSNRASQYGETLSSQENTVDNTTAEGLTVPDAAVSALVTAGAVACRWRTDGVAPTASVGHYLAANENIEVFGADMDTFKIIATATTSVLFITYYKD